MDDSSKKFVSQMLGKENALTGKDNRAVGSNYCNKCHKRHRLGTFCTRQEDLKQNYTIKGDIDNALTVLTVLIDEGFVPFEVKISIENEHVAKGLIVDPHGLHYYFRIFGGYPKVIPTNAEFSEFLLGSEYQTEAILTYKGVGAAVSSKPFKEVLSNEKYRYDTKHPGAATSDTADTTSGRDWHHNEDEENPKKDLKLVKKSLTFKKLDLSPIRDSNLMFSTWVDNFKEIGKSFTEKYSDEEKQFLKHLGFPEEDIFKGVKLPPRFKVDFLKWRSERLYKSLRNITK